jgi:cellulase/cellobiase CelA1
MSRTARWLAIFATGLALSCGSLGANAATAPVPSPSASGTPQPCADPGPAPTGVTATVSLVGTDSVQARLTWTPLVEPANCSPGVVEIEQVSPAGPTITAPSASREITISGLSTLTAYTWRLRYVAGTVSQWATVSVAAVPGAASSACTAASRLESDWGSGFVTTVTVRNTSTTPLRAWSTSWSLPADVQVTTVWMASGTTLDHTFSASSVSWNSQLAPGSSTTFGFLATRSGSGTITPAFSCTGSEAVASDQRS